MRHVLVKFIDKTYLLIYKLMEVIYDKNDNQLFYSNYTLLGIISVIFVLPFVLILDYKKVIGMNRGLSYLVAIPLLYFLNHLLEKRYTLIKLLTLKQEKILPIWKYLFLLFLVIYFSIYLWNIVPIGYGNN